jgi:ubiquinone/menaquinone biosynthesis C-methylase UbiE
MGRMYEESIRDEFTRQTESFARNPVALRAETLDALVELAPADPEARWLEVACGPGLIARALAARVGAVEGVDLTPSMVEKAVAEAAREEIANASFAVGDATALDFDDGRFDGAITRFSLHHIPVPGRVLEEMARVVRPHGHAIVMDHLADPDRDVYAWAEEIERLRDPSHWSSLTEAQLRSFGEAAGLELDSAETIPLEIEFEEWLGRGSGGPAAAPLIERLLREAPPGAGCFRVDGEPPHRRLHLRSFIARWRQP